MWSYIIFAIIVIFILCFLAWAWEEPAGGIIGIIGVACYIHAKSENSPEKIKERRFPPVHFTLSSTGSYSSILNECEQIVWAIAKRCPWLEFHVLIMVSKINSTKCSISFSIEDVPFENYNITFGNEFKIDPWDTAHFETEQATGFTTAQDVMRELNLQFHWYDVSTHITQSKIYDQGDVNHNPMVLLDFDVKYKE